MSAAVDIARPGIGPGSVLDRKVVSVGPDQRAEWQLVVQEEGNKTLWRPCVVNNTDQVISHPSFLPLPGSQTLFLECPIYEALYEGTRGPGKTITLIMDFCREIGKGYGRAWRGILFRREYKDLDDVVKKIEEFFPQVFGEEGADSWRLLRAKSEYRVQWATGEALLLRAGEDEDAYKTFHGHEYPWIGFEELTQWEDDGLFLKMQSCSRSSTPGMPCRVRATTNPYGVGHNWVKKRYQLPKKAGSVLREPGQMPRVAIKGHLAENFLLLHATPNYAITIKNAARSAGEAKAWIEGDWDVTAGGMIDDLWDSDIHVLPSIPAALIPGGWSITRAYDHGQSKPFATGWFLESNGEPLVMPDGAHIGRVRGDIILWHEWYGTSGNTNEGLRLSPKRIAQGIIDREEDWGVRQGQNSMVQAGPADTEIFTPNTAKDNKSPADDMEAIGVFWEPADKSKGSRKRGWSELRSLLSAAKPGKDGTREDPGFFVTEDCKHWLELCPPMPRSPSDPDEVSDKYEDHHADMTRYRITWEVPFVFRRGF